MVLLRLSLCVLLALNSATVSQTSPLGPLDNPSPPSHPARFKRQARQDEIVSLVQDITGKTVSDGAALAQTLGSLFGGASGPTTQHDGTGPSLTISDFLSQNTVSASGPSDGSPSSTVLDPLSQTTASTSRNSPSLSISDPPSQYTASASGSTTQLLSDDGAGPSPTIPTASVSDSSDDAGLPAISDPLSQITASVSGVSVSSSPLISGSAGSVTLPILGPASHPTATSAFTACGSDSDSEAGLVLSLISKLADSLPTSIIAPPISVGSGSEPWDGSDDPSGTNNSDDDSPSHNVGHHGDGVSRDCTETYKVVSGDTCAAIINVFNLTAADFLRMNPTVGAACTKLEVEQEYCVQWGFRGMDDEGCSWDEGDAGYECEVWDESAPISTDGSIIVESERNGNGNEAKTSITSHSLATSLKKST